MAASGSSTFLQRNTTSHQESGSELDSEIFICHGRGHSGISQRSIVLQNDGTPHPTSFPFLSSLQISDDSRDVTQVNLHARSLPKNHVKPVGELKQVAKEDRVDKHMDLMPDPATVQSLFQDVLNCCGIDANHQDALISKLSLEKKWQTVVLFQRQTLLKSQSNQPSSHHSLEAFAAILQTSKLKDLDIDLFKQVYIKLKHEPATLLIVFCQCGIIEGLVRILSKLYFKKQRTLKHWRIHLEIIKLVSLVLLDKSHGHTYLLCYPVLLHAMTQTSLLHHHSIDYATLQHDVDILPSIFSSAFPNSLYIPPLTNRISWVNLLVDLLKMNSRDSWDLARDTLNEACWPFGKEKMTTIVQVKSLLKMKESSACLIDSKESDTPSVKALGKQSTHTTLVTQESTPLLFKTWLKEFQECVLDRFRWWSLYARKSREVFNFLANGTYIWQKIVPAPTDRVSETEAIEYLLAHVYLATSLLEKCHPNTSEKRNELRAQMNQYRFSAILQKLKSANSNELNRVVQTWEFLSRTDNKVTDHLPTTSDSTAESLIRPPLADTASLYDFIQSTESEPDMHEIGRVERNQRQGAARP